MAFVVKCSITGEYLTSSQARYVDDTDLEYAKRYSESGAKSAAAYNNRIFGAWHDTDQSLFKNNREWWDSDENDDWTDDDVKDPDRYLRNFEVVEI